VLPSYPLDLWKVSHFNCGRGAAQFHPEVIVVSSLNALDQIDVQGIF